MKHEFFANSGRRSGLALLALLIIPAAAAVLAGCSRVVTPPIAFAQEGLTAGYTFVEGQQIAAVTLPQATDGSEELTYSLTPAVPGLTLHESTRVLSGTPTEAGTYPVTYAATNADGKTTSLKLVITVVKSFAAVNSLRGTWRMTADWWRDGVRIGSHTDTLTFTASRYIMHRTHFVIDGSNTDDWAKSGTWTSTDMTVTRIRMEDDDDDDDTPRIETTATTGYYWGDESRSKLLMWGWDWFGDGNESYYLYERVEDPLPSIVGTWTESSERTDADGVNYTRHRLVEINADGTYVYRDYVPGRWSWRLTANWTENRSEMFVLLTNPVLEFTRTIDGVEVPQPIDHWSWISLDDTLRMAYAPTLNSPSEIRVSTFSSEPGWEDRDTVDISRRYGDYWLQLNRQQ